MMHIIGLTWWLRSTTADAAQGLNSLAQVVGIGLMGLVAIIRGVIFLVIIIRSVL